MTKFLGPGGGLTFSDMIATEFGNVLENHGSQFGNKLNLRESVPPPRKMIVIALAGHFQRAKVVSIIIIIHRKSDIGWGDDGFVHGIQQTGQH